MRKKKRKQKIIVGVSAGAGGILLIVFITLCFWKFRKTKIDRKTAAAALELQARDQNTRQRNTWESRIVPFDDIAAATDNFSATNIIGEGGFGVVYKTMPCIGGESQGTLPGGQEIAVKRLTNQSEMGIQGFEREVMHIRVAQHKNIVRLIGYFCDDNEKIIVYELLENSSLDNHLFEKTGSSILSWNQRLDITKGIARGLSYLHHDSRFRIIHLDLKPSNVLLGRDMIPKISDFGMAQTLAQDKTEDNATTVGGTYGYKSFSVKSDVFSFGVMVLEIVTGIKCKEYPKHHDGDNLLCVIWNKWKEGNGMEMLDQAIKDSPSGNNLSELEVIRCIQIGLLCVQHDAEDRPTMETGSSSSSPREPQECESSSINQITISAFDAR
ncbi:unnamed protein product [Microthlaspi erraticum]|uniref:non-specific serine/threonine protein kinase n=1 Tax=Microthlaspi erraticum TaxID=1685480 RepID=A0A6D2K6G4_9BRAS|nr:unnamed protein product [Microthlaspi erraticum]